LLDASVADLGIQQIVKLRKIRLSNRGRLGVFGFISVAGPNGFNLPTTGDRVAKIVVCPFPILESVAFESDLRHRRHTPYWH
jgi:hypothetical protein